jgi:hypothetical protein
MAAKSDAEFEAVMDALSLVYGLREGHVLTQDDVAAIALYDAHSREDQEHQLDAYHRGYQDGLLTAGGADLQALNNKLDAKSAELGAERALRMMERQWGFREGAQAMREMLARFVEQGGDATTATSLRLNWNPSWGADPGPPDEHDDSPAFPSERAA